MILKNVYIDFLIAFVTSTRKIVAEDIQYNEYNSVVNLQHGIRNEINE